MKLAVVVFPGSNCDHDAYYASEQNAGIETIYLWHKDSSIPKDIDCVILPGGFSYGDYLRCGSIARFSPIMNAVNDFAKKGGIIIGICNGFQILLEAGLLPGAMLRNESLNFRCKDVRLRVMNNSVAWTSLSKVGDVLRIPIAHGEGNYFIDEGRLKQLEDDNLIVFKYCDVEGNITQEANPNGSLNNIAGIINKEGNVLGMMPHPERYSDELMGCSDGLWIFKSIDNFLSKNKG